MAILSKSRNVSKSKSKTFFKINKGSSSRKHFIKSRKSGLKSRKMSGGASASASARANSPNSKPKQLKDYEIIRIFISGAAGFGNQRASLTLMYKLRLLGFTGTFDIRYIDKYPAQIELTPYLFQTNAIEVEKINKEKGFVGRAISMLIPEFKPDPNYDPVKQESFHITSETFGDLIITRLPYLPFSVDQQSYNLFETDLTMCGADDSMILVRDKDKLAKDILHKFNTKNYFSFVPTDWYNGVRFIITNTNEKVLYKQYDFRFRLSSEKLFHYNSNEYENSIKKLLLNKECFSQLVYGLNNIEYFLPISTVVNNLLSALTQLKIDGYILLLFPQNIFEYITRVIYNDNFKKTVSIVSNLDNFKPETTKPHKIYLLHIGKLRPQFFDDLMVNLTTLPPVIEGCNSIETCETNARLYLHSSKMGYKINDYGKSDYSAELELHKSACLPLEKGEHDIHKTAEFLSAFLNNLLLDYAKQRQTEHLERPDLIRTALIDSKILTVDIN